MSKDLMTSHSTAEKQMAFDLELCNLELPRSIIEQFIFRTLGR